MAYSDKQIYIFEVRTWLTIFSSGKILLSSLHNILKNFLKTFCTVCY